jgi:CSLREA domain-containing protein
MTARTLALAAALLLAFATPASAADFLVTSTEDDGNGVCADVPADCTLRDAVNEAGPSDRVLIPQGPFELTEGELVLNGDTVIGAGARLTSIQGDGDSRVLHAASGTNVVSGVTVMAGGGEGAALGRVGGGILVRSANLTVVESTITGNEAGQGGGLANFGGTLNILRSTISDNFAGMATSGAQGGGIYSAGATYLRNSTVSGNVARSGESFDARGGGVFMAGGTFVSQGATIANNGALGGVQNTPVPGSAIAGHLQVATSATLSHTIIADSLGPACANAPFQGSLNVIDDQTCVSTPVDPGLGPLENNGGPTDTHPIGLNSPAVDTGSACEPGDQRGFARRGNCDIGSYEFGNDPGLAPPILWVVTEVVNDSGGTLTPGQVNVHVRAGGVDDDESPQSGDRAGRSYTIAPGVTHTVAAAAPLTYTVVVGGQCAPTGTIALQNSEVRVCTVRLDDIPGSQPPQGGGGGQQHAPPEPLPPPVAGKSVNVQPSGTVKVKRPGSNRFVELTEHAQLPVGTVVDALKGRVILTAAGGQTATFYGGIFKIGQGKGARPLTTLTLVEKLTCPKAGSAIAAARKKKRRLWGDGSGKFRTKGKHSAATVVGTKWLVEDRCASTLTRVVRGRVSVRDFAKKKTVIVRAGKKYVARAKKK